MTIIGSVLGRPAKHGPSDRQGLTGRAGFSLKRGRSGRRASKWGALALVAAGLVLPAAASAQTYPRRPVTFVVGYAPGGTGDVVARLVAQKLSGALGQSVVVENRAGASGGIAAQGVAKAQPDGHTILVGQSAEIAINPHWVKGITYNPEKDLQPIALGVIVPLGLVVPAKAPYSTLPDLLAASRSSKDGLTFASAGTGTPSQFAGELLKLRTQGKLTHAPYKGRVTAVGGTLGYTFTLGQTPVSTRVKVLREVEVENRFRGTIGFVQVSFPL